MLFYIESSTVWITAYFFLFFCNFSVVKMFAQNKEDKKRVEKALEACGVSAGKVIFVKYVQSLIIQSYVYD